LARRFDSVNRRQVSPNKDKHRARIACKRDRIRTFVGAVAKPAFGRQNLYSLSEPTEAAKHYVSENAAQTSKSKYAYNVSIRDFLSCR
jgi:hypothetical protein